jgi:hypothetical protein
MSTAVMVNGDYWHGSVAEEEYLITELVAALVAEGKSVNINPVVLWSKDASTFEAAYAFLNAKIGKG